MNALLGIYENALDAKAIVAQWYDNDKKSNFGAMIHFIGVVRAEDGIEGLSFDIYEPILTDWFENWQEKAKSQNAKVLMAHSKGDVPVHKCSYVAGVCSPSRKVALSMIDEFVEDFKKNAPIWKYDIKGGVRVYAEERSQKMEGAGLLRQSSK